MSSQKTNFFSNSFKKKTILKYLIGNIIIILIFTIVLVPYLKDLYNKAKQETYDSQKKIISDYCNDINKELTYFINFSRTARSSFSLGLIARETSISPTTHYNILQVQSLFKNQVINTNFVKETFFIFKKNEIFISSNYSIVKPQSYYHILFGFSDKTYQEFRLSLLKPGKPYFLHQNNILLYGNTTSKSMIPFVIPMSNPFISYPQDYDSSLVCYLDVNEIQNTIVNLNTEFDYYYLSFGNEILLEYNPNHISLNTEEEIISEPGNDLLTFHVKVKPSLLSKEIAKASFMLKLYFCIALLLSIIFSVIIAFYNGIPVVQMNYSLSSLNDNITEKNEEIRVYQENERNFYFCCLIDNTYQYYDTARFLSTFPFLDTHYRIALVMISDDLNNHMNFSSDLEMKQILSYIYDAFPDILYFNVIDNNYLLFIVNEELINSCKCFQKELLSFCSCDTLKQCYYSCVISKPTKGLHDFYTSYHQAELYLRIKYEPGQNLFYLCAESFEEHSSPISLKSLQVLYKDLLDGHYNDIKKMLTSFYQLIHNGSILTEKSIRSIYFSLNNILSFVILDFHLPVMLIEYNEASTIYDLFKSLLSVAKEICYHTSIAKKDKVINYLDEYYHFIEENFKDINLSPAMIAAHLGFSEKYLFNYIKSNTGRTISSHILEKRMLYAANELLQQNKTIQEIAKDCGYYTITSFYNNFKKCFGVAPTIWKKENSHKTSINELPYLP